MSSVVDKSPLQFKDKYFMDLAFSVSQGSKCIRAKYGSVVVGSNGHIVSTGYNGKPAGCTNDHICYREGLPPNAGENLVLLDTRLISLSQGEVAYVDSIDYDWLSQWKWFYSKGYAARNSKIDDPEGRGYLIYMHRVVMSRVLNRPLDSSEEVDHKYGITVDNRRSSIRLCNHQENLSNGKNRKNNTSGFPGVGRRRDKWRAYIKKDGKFKHLGLYDTPEEAHNAYAVKSKELFGEFTRVHTEVKHNCCLHSEVNALMFCSPEERAGGCIYVSGIPCNDCALVIMQSGLSRIVYFDGASASGHRGCSNDDYWEKYRKASITRVAYTEEKWNELYKE